MKRGLTNRALSLLLVLSLLLGLAPAVYASGGGERTVTFEEASSDSVTADLKLEGLQTPGAEEADSHSPDEMARVSIVLEKAPVLDKGYSTMGFASNQQAVAYRQELLADQLAMTARISEATGQELDVAWNLTLAGNIISANVRCGDIKTIEDMQGVSRVVLETRYEPCETEESSAQPNMATASSMTGANAAWASGYTGVGTRIAVIDTGVDIDHQSVDAGAFEHALEEYKGSIDLMDEDEISAVLAQLNAYKNYDQNLTADQLYVNKKVPFAYNYVDKNLNITHDNDAMGGHGSHVVGIAAANRYVPDGDGYADALETVHMTGVAPDAQLIIMKVFGQNGGAFDSDYMAAIEDAVLLNCDSINLSLGSVTVGFTTNDLYQEIFNKLTQSDAVVTISAGNSYAWPENTTNSYLYSDDVSFATLGSPGTYDNAFTVASVNNYGATGVSFQVEDRSVVYTESNSGAVKPLITLDRTGEGTDYEYVFLDGIGTAGEYDGLNVAGKVIFVSRGEINFSVKLDNAANANAAACIVYNNTSGTFGMDLTDSSATIPCVSITQGDADAIRERSTAVGEGIYTGTLTITHDIASSVIDAENLSMSAFSSWGVTGALTLKPETAAPGGNIYSIDGATRETDQYVQMSGTSMAAPHTAGLVALLAQYIREDETMRQLDVSPRELVQSLLMSNATPVKDSTNNNLPYPVIQQGAGLANVADVMAAASYVTVSGQSDGKVKAEVKDNADGVYAFDYTLHNLTDQEQQYVLGGDMYTQSYFTGKDGKTYTALQLMKLAANITFTVNGKEIKADAADLCDHDGDGDADKDDAQALLDYAVGKRTSITNTDEADLNGDGKVTAHDAELYLKRMTEAVVTLPANGDVTVSVGITLTEDAKSLLKQAFPNGAYVEGYVTATPKATDEGLQASAHSIPVLGFYGSWDDPNMFDRTTYTAKISGKKEYTSYVPVDQALTYVVANDKDGNPYYLGGNAFVNEEKYMPERNAISSEGNAAISALAFNLIRNAAKMRGAIIAGGEIVAEQEYDRVISCIYCVNDGGWYGVGHSVVPGAREDDQDAKWPVIGKDGSKLAEDTEVTFTLQAVPEYSHYMNNNGTVNWSQVNDLGGNMLSLSATVDNTAPVIEKVSTGTSENGGNYVDVVVKDNRYTAAILTLNSSGKVVVSRQAVNQEELGAEMTVHVDLSGVFGNAFKLAAVDYAGNVTYYDVQVGEAYEGPTNTLYGATAELHNATWYRFETDTSYDKDHLCDSKQNIYAAAYAEGYVFFLADGEPSSQTNGADGFYLYAVDFEKQYYEPLLVGKTDLSHPVFNLTYQSDMLEDYGALYYVQGSALYKMNLLDAASEKVCDLSTNGYTITSLAYSEDDHCFYALGYQANPDGESYTTVLLKFNGYVYGDDSAESCEVAANLGSWSTMDSKLVLDQDKYNSTNSRNVAYILRADPVDADQVTSTPAADILTYDFDAKTLTPTGRTEAFYAVCLPKQGEERLTVDTPTSVTVTPTTVELLVTKTEALTAEVKPWCVPNKSVTWSSSDEEVATVNENGMVTAVAPGTATITATTVAGNMGGVATVTVTGVGSDYRYTFSGVGTKADGTSVLFACNDQDGLTEGETVVDTNGEKLSVESATASVDGSSKIWVQDRAEGYKVHEIDLATGKSGYDSGPNESINANYQDDCFLYNSLAYVRENLAVGVLGDDNYYISTGSLRNKNDIGTNKLMFYNSFHMGAVATGKTWEEEETFVGGVHVYTDVYTLDIKNHALLWLRVGTSWNNGWDGFVRGDMPINQKLTYVTDANGRYQESLAYDAVTDTLLLFHYTTSGTEVYLMKYDAEQYCYDLELLTTLTGFTDVAVYACTYNPTGGEQTQSQSDWEPITGHEVSRTGEREDARGIWGDVNEIASGVTEPVMLSSKTIRGSLNMAADEPVKAAEEDVYTITLRNEENAASGMATLALGEGVEFMNLTGYADLNSYQYREETGEVVFGYASTEDIAEGGITAVLTVKVPTSGTVTVAETERGGKNPETDPVVVCVGDDHQDCPSKAFTDLDTDKWYHEGVDYVLKQKLMNGMGGGVFAPNANVTRGMLVTVLYRMAEEPEIQKAAPFADVKAGSYYAKAVTWAYENGIVKGVTTERFAPNSPATREQLATMLYRYSKNYKGEDVSVKGSLKTFEDGSAVSAYAWEATAWAVGAGLLRGDDFGKLLPKNIATRAQLATIITRFLAQ